MDCKHSQQFSHCPFNTGHIHFRMLSTNTSISCFFIINCWMILLYSSSLELTEASCCWLSTLNQKSSLNHQFVICISQSNYTVLQQSWTQSLLRKTSPNISQSTPVVLMCWQAKEQHLCSSDGRWGCWGKELSQQVPIEWRTCPLCAIRLNIYSNLLTQEILCQ